MTKLRVTTSWGSEVGTLNVEDNYVDAIKNLLQGIGLKVEVVTPTPPPEPPPVPKPLVISTPGLPSGKVGQPYMASLSVESATQPVTWTAKGLPPGLTMDSNGKISGTPSSAAPFAVDFTVSDSSNPQRSGAISFTISVTAADPPPATEKYVALPSGWTQRIAWEFDQPLSNYVSSDGKKPLKYMDEGFGRPGRKVSNQQANVKIENSQLVLTATRSGKPDGDAAEFNVGGVWTRGTSTKIPLQHYGCIDFTTSHGQGVWPALWLTAAVGRGSNCEIDMMEYFHVAEPGIVRATVWQDPSGGYSKQVWNSSQKRLADRVVFEKPTLTPGKHRLEWVVKPVGTAPNAVTAVQYYFWVDGKEFGKYTETSRLEWVKKEDPARAFDLLMNMQITGPGGADVCHPDDKLGFDRYDNSQKADTTGILRAGFDAAGTKKEAQEANFSNISMKIDCVRIWA